MIVTDNSHLHVAAATHPGMRGKNNEDRYGVTAYQVSVDNPTPSVFAIVSDGIGGHRAGEVAATIAVEKISQIITDSQAEDPQDVLYSAIVEAGEAIRQKAESEVSQKGMGATCACAWVIGNRLFTANVGDSRIYLIRGERIQKLSTDHTWIQEALDVGALTPEQARGHPNAHVIRRYLGSPQPVTPDLRLHLHVGENDSEAEANQGMRLHSGDILLLCSDGLTDLVGDAEILAIIQERNLDEALDELVALANSRGGHDNITIVAMSVPKSKVVEEIPPPVIVPGRRRRLLPVALGCGVLTILLVAILSVVGAYGLLVVRPFSTATPTSTSTRTATATATITPEPTASKTATFLPNITPEPNQGQNNPPAIVKTLNAPATIQGPTYTPWPTSTKIPKNLPGLLPTVPTLTSP